MNVYKHKPGVANLDFRFLILIQGWALASAIIVEETTEQVYLCVLSPHPLNVLTKERETSTARETPLKRKRLLRETMCLY